MTIEVVLLGTGNPLPDPNRAGAATLVRAGGLTLLFDAGRGVCMRLAGAGALPVMLDAVVLTHLHSDHVCDLNDVVTTAWVMSPVPKMLPIVRSAGHAAGRRRDERDARARRRLPASRTTTTSTGIRSSK